MHTATAAGDDDFDGLHVFDVPQTERSIEAVIRFLLTRHPEVTDDSVDNLVQKCHMSVAGRPVALGSGVALAQVEDQRFSRPCVFAGQLDNPIVWSSPDGIAVKVLFLLTARDSHGILSNLSRISRYLQRE